MRIEGATGEMRSENAKNGVKMDNNFEMVQSYIVAS